MSHSLALSTRQKNYLNHTVSQTTITSYSLTHKKLFSQWLTEHETLLRHMITGFEAKKALQEELFQDIAMNIWRALPSYREEASVKTFVARIAHNILATHVAKAVKTVKADQALDEVDQIVVQDTVQPTPYQSLDKQQRQQRLANAIRKLPLKQQQVVTLALEGMSYVEISTILSISTNLVGVRLQRAKLALNTLLEK